MLDVQPWTTPEGDFCLRCQMQDANPDLQSIKASIATRPANTCSKASPAIPTIFKIAGQQIPNQTLKITASDLCGNTVTRDVNLREMLAAVLQTNRNAAQKIAAGSADPLPPMTNVPGDLIRTEAQRPALPAVPQMEKIADFAPPPNPPMANPPIGNPPMGNPPMPSQAANVVQPLPSAPVPYLPSVPPMPKYEYSAGPGECSRPCPTPTSPN